MARPYVTEVESNIQGGVKVKLGPKTLIIGPNRIGKSSIVRAIELACSGKASDVAGRTTLALDADLWTLAPADAEIASAEAHFSNDANATWALARGKKSKRSGQSAIFPLRDVRTAILGSAETARKFFLSVATRITWETVLVEIPPQFHAKLTPYKSPDGAAGLLAAIEGTKKRVREINAEVKAQRATAQSLAAGLPPPPSAAEVERAKTAGENATKATSVAGAAARLAVVEAEGRQTADRLEAAQRTADALEAKLAALPAVVPLPAVVEHAIAVGEYLSQHDVDACPICGGATPKSKIVFQARVANAKKKVAETARIMALRRLIEDELSREKNTIASEYAKGQRIVAERDSLKAIIGSAPAVDATPVGDYAALVAAAAKWQSVRVAEGRAAELEADAAAMAALPDLCSTALARLLDKTRAVFEAKVQRYLPASMHFGMELRDGDREVCRIGLRVEGHCDGMNEGLVLRTALSGAEWATVTAALASAVAESTETIGSNDPVIVIPEDRDFDANTLADVMDRLTSFDGQVIMTGTKPPSRGVSGWTIIDLGEANSIPWCEACEAWIAVGPCAHGIGKTPPKAGDIFG